MIFWGIKVLNYRLVHIKFTFAVGYTVARKIDIEYNKLTGGAISTKYGKEVKACLIYSTLMRG